MEDSQVYLKWTTEKYLNMWDFICRRLLYWEYAIKNVLRV